jgi:hypothetical protein
VANITFEWVTNQRTPIDADVSITMVKAGKDREQIAFRFRNNSYLKITNNLYVVYAVHGSRIYFTTSDVKKGFRLSFEREKFETGSFKSKPSTKTDMSRFIGDYDLIYDRELLLHYVDMGKKK